ncbi:MAG: divergent PAP2 family protein [Peptococcaceae bacterium]
MQLLAVLENRVLIAAVLAWFIAQVLKVVLVFWKEKRIDFSRMVGSGGMPSSHSALITAMAASVGKYAGLDSVLFAIAATVAMVVMYDAANVRREAGRQAELLNKIVLDLYRDNHLDQEKLKELLGHTPVEVAAGMVLGIAVGVFV